MTVPVLSARSLYRFFRAGEEETFALQGVGLEVGSGETVAVTGPSGSGKTTLLNCLAGLDEPDGGTVTVAGERLSHRPERERSGIRARHIGMVFQSGNLLEHLTVRDNVALVQRLVAARTRVPPQELLERTGIAHRADALPRQLSGGEAARAGLAVALANAPEVLLADEPTGEVDGETERRLLALLRERAADGTAVVVVTHSRAVAAVADRVLRLRDGRWT
ncbi:ABC transporter ATP-binding protein [Streptomyces mobaraensis NBRC 13819 = DSM 40847]|uniref:ABC transporter ATP-binding protein n=2 Tax=Streptomyces TaxID=1883 RepID=A0A919B2C9_9ACTN|nr:MULTISPECIES: ABC transporter ATP-binding protein [Streptomyces]QTT74697.1 ABC transporter ATP-binding protein [Streptomyces mobaraensis NBRC 13819 = DSM 40847]GHF43298.1 ABC transporter ATP-binding protein [Streptomyces mashuensis]